MERAWISHAFPVALEVFQRGANKAVGNDFGRTKPAVGQGMGSATSGPLAAPPLCVERWKAADCHGPWGCGELEGASCCGPRAPSSPARPGRLR